MASMALSRPTYRMSRVHCLITAGGQKPRPLPQSEDNPEGHPGSDASTSLLNPPAQLGCLRSRAGVVPPITQQANLQLRVVPGDTGLNDGCWKHWDFNKRSVRHIDAHLVYLRADSPEPEVRTLVQMIREGNVL